LKKPTEFKVEAVTKGDLTISKVSGISTEEIVEKAAARFGIQLNEIKLIAIEGKGIIVTIHSGDKEGG